MSTLHLDKLVCVDAQEDSLFSNGDEIYFTFRDNGGTTGPVTTKIYEGMDAHDERIFDGQPGHEAPVTFNFSGSMNVSLVEDDGPGSISDDVIHTFTLPEPHQPLTFADAGVKYDLYYHIT